MLKNRKQLMRVLIGVVKGSKSVENKAFATALLYLINETVPKDRSTRRIEDELAR